MNLLKSTYNNELIDPYRKKIKRFDAKQKSQMYWKSFLPKQDYKTLVTIQPKMRNKYIFEDRMRAFSELQRVQGLFYSVEQNAFKDGYHIHLMFNAFNCDKMSLSFALDTPINTIPYYKGIDSKVAVSNYVLKHMKADQIHYNIY
jgi:hypothetical protein